MKITENKLQNVIDFCETFPKNADSTASMLKRYEEYRVGLLARCPFQVGDKVCLYTDPNITEETAPGWMHAKHFLVVGAKATVKEFDFWSGKFRFGLYFDDEAYMISGVPSLVKNKSLYYFAEDELTLVEKKTAEDKPESEPVPDPIDKLYSHFASFLKTAQKSIKEFLNDNI